MLNIILSLAYLPVHVGARIISWIFGLYGLLVLAMAWAAGRAADNVMIYGKPLLCCIGIRILDRILRRAVSRIAAMLR